MKAVANTEPTGVEDRVCQDIAERQRLGLAKYGVEVEHNPLRLREWLQHAYEECLDQAVYLRAAIERLDHKLPKVGDVGEAIQAVRAAGLDAWDEIDDPERLIREMRGNDGK